MFNIVLVKEITKNKITAKNITKNKIAAKKIIKKILNFLRRLLKKSS